MIDDTAAAAATTATAAADLALGLYARELNAQGVVTDAADVARLRFELESGAAVLWPRDQAFAILRKPGSFGQVLCFVWVEPARRRTGYGRRLVLELLAQFPEYPWRLKCHVDQRAFFTRLGFRVVERAGVLREMQSR